MIVLMRREKETRGKPLSRSRYMKALTTPTGRTRLHSLALSNLHCRLVVRCGRPHPLFNLASHCQESLLNVARILRGRLKERNAQRISKFLQRGNN